MKMNNTLNLFLTVLAGLTAAMSSCKKDDIHLAKDGSPVTEKTPVPVDTVKTTKVDTVAYKSIQETFSSATGDMTQFSYFTPDNKEHKYTPASDGNNTITHTGDLLTPAETAFSSTSTTTAYGVAATDLNNSRYQFKLAGAVGNIVLKPTDAKSNIVIKNTAATGSIDMPFVNTATNGMKNIKYNAQ